MYNRVVLMGRICNDLELRTTPTGLSVLSFNLAVDRKFVAKGEERKADFFPIVAWRQTAEFINRYFYKGRMILIEGELQTRQYVDKNNITRYVTEIVADGANFTGEPKAANSESAPQGTYQPPKDHPAETNNTPSVVSQGTAEDFVSVSDTDEEYPF